MTIAVDSIQRKNYQPFVKWVGGKRNLLSQIIPLLPKEFNSYFEPFVGGGALFFELFSLGKLQGKKVYLFDINAELINTYNIVKEKPDLLITELERFKKEHSKEFYYEIRAWDREKNFVKVNKVLRAARFIYLNKTCFNGLYRVNKQNQNNVPIGSYKNPNICNVEVILNASEALQNAILKNITYSKILQYANKDDFIYFDPPYYPLNETANFTSYSEFNFLENEQFELYETFNKLNDKGCKVAQSNSDTPFIKQLYKNFDIQKIQANRFINSKSSERGKISELLISNNTNQRKIKNGFY